MERTDIEIATTTDTQHARECADWLCVDLDGTLVDSDMLLESALELIKRNPLAVLMLPLWLIKGRANLKARIAARVDLNVEHLPYNRDVIDHLRRHKAAGRRLCLATGSHAKLARKIAAHIGLFDDVLASDAVNMTGSTKAAALVERFGHKRFDYVGNCGADIPAWRCANQAWSVNHVAAAARREGCAHLQPFPSQRTRSPAWKAWPRALRLHQWLKNLLLFVPAAAAHAGGADVLLPLAVAFLAFGLCASSVYVLNDLLDLQDDRQHPRKRRRPFAAGELPISHGIVAAPALLIVSFGLAAALLPPLFLGILAAYYLTTLAYSLRLKQIALVDVYVLAALYTARLAAGAVVTGITVSFWLIALSIFAFLSLALLKRYAEQVGQLASGSRQSGARGYTAGDLQILAVLGGASGFAAVLVLALYLNSSDVLLLYSRPQFIWLACPLLLYWISRAWLLAHRNQMHDDPVVFAVTDRTSQAVVALTLAAAVVAL